jgi:Cu+-exporting ATPase
LPTETPIEEENFKRIVFSLEKYSNHPIAKCITKSWQTSNDVRWKAIQEIKGVGMKAEDKQGNVFIVGSFQVAAALTKEKEHNVYVLKNGVLLGWIDVQDELRAEAQEVVRYFTSNQIRTILLSGDRREKCEAIARELGIDEVIAEQSPADKLNKIEQLDRQSPTAMIGDGINDAPALAKATIGVSMSDATHIAVQTSDVILMNNGISHFPLALGLGKHTFITIQQNLYWALFYNAMAIPVAGLGFLSPPLAALLMGLSDIVLAANSIRLSRKKII